MGHHYGYCVCLLHIYSCPFLTVYKFKKKKKSFMSKIQEKLDSLQPYVVGIRYIQGMQIVDAVFKDGWTVPNSEIILKELVDESQNYYMFYSQNEGVTIDDLLDYVESIIGINIEREKKYELLKRKVEELKQLFKDNTLSRLEKLKFVFSESGIMPSMSDMDDINIEENITEKLEEKINKPVPADPEEVKKTSKKVNSQSKTAEVKGQKIELPPKSDKIEVEDFEEPKITCKCGPNEVCPVCEEEKIGHY